MMLLLWKITSLAVSQRLNIVSSCDSVVILLTIDWREMKTSLHKNSYTNAHTVLNRPQVEATQMSISQWMVKQNMVYPYEEYWAMTGNEVLTHTTTWTDLENIMLREWSRPKRLHVAWFHAIYRKCQE